MRTVEIPSEFWVPWADGFSLIHKGWLVSLDVLDPEIGAQPEIDNLPLIGVSAEGADHDRRISVSVGRSATEHFTHSIHDVTRLYVERTDEGDDAALEIESVDGARTVLRFRVTALPETVDGIARQ